MDSIQCAVALAKLDRFGWEVERRLEVASRYNEFMDQAGICRVQQREDRTSVYAQYTIFAEERDTLALRLQEAGIPTAVHYRIPLNLQPAYKDLCCLDCTPEAEKISEKVISLPMGPGLGAVGQDTIMNYLTIWRRDRYAHGNPR